MNEVPKEALIWEERDQPQMRPTFGEKLVGITFNPSNDDKVGKAKKLFAEAADLLHDEFYAISPIQVSELHKTLYEHSIGEILNAQMNVVKVLTLKY